MGPGVHYVSWDGRNSRGREIPSGVYSCRLETGEKVRTAKVMYLKEMVLQAVKAWRQ
jgi:hypothetical protein